MIRKAYPRISIAGNPSDGFWGKTLSMTFSNYSAECGISSSDSFVFQRQGGAESTLGDYGQLEHVLDYFFPVDGIGLPPDVERNKLALAVVKTFFNFCQLNRIRYDKKPSRISYSSTIPYGRGFSGSTALSTSILRALNDFYGTNICGHDIGSMVLHAETHELGRNAGPQDPVSVGMEGCVYMDFSKDAYRQDAAGENLSSLEKAVVHVQYSRSNAYLSNTPIGENGTIRHTTLPKVEKIKAGEIPLFIINERPGKDSSEELSPTVEDYISGRRNIREGMQEMAGLADKAKEAIIKGDIEELGRIINEGFELNVRYLDNEYLGRQRIEFVRELIREGAYAKFPGSSGAVFGIYPSEGVFQRLKRRFGKKIEKLRNS